MHWDWDEIKKRAGRWYSGTAEFLLFQSLMGYLVACISCGHPCSLGAYVRFLDYLLNTWPGLVK